MRMHGTMAGSGGFTSTYLLELKRPNLVRTEFTFNGTTAIQATDGTTGWTVMPPPGKPVAPPTPMSPRQIQDLEQAADIDGRLLDAKAKGFQVELVGKESVGTAAAWKTRTWATSCVTRRAISRFRRPTR